MQVLLIGYGSIGKRHADILKGITKIKKLDVVTNQNISLCKTYKRIEDVDIAKYDYYIISSETYKHYNQLKYLENNLRRKIIFVEKPLFNEYKDLQIRNNVVYVGYNLRFHPILQKIKEIISNQKILYVHAFAGQYLPTWRPSIDYRKSYSSSKEKGGGVLLDLSHEIDYIQWLFGKLSINSSIIGKISDLEINSDDIVTVIGQTEKKVIVNFTLDYISKIPIRQITIHTNEKTIIGDLIKSRLVIKDTKNLIEDDMLAATDRNYTYLRMHDSIINNKVEDVCNFQEALMVMKTIEKIKENMIF